MKTEVCITVDVEYSVAGAFGRPDLYKPLGTEVVECRVEGREHGLGFILDSLRRYGMTATFFTEALQTAYFGDDSMRAIAERIVTAGQDLQLHLHPCWLHFKDERWMQKGFAANDSCAGRTDADLDELIGLGIETFLRWGVPPPVALRTGGFRTDRAVFRAMARAGLRLASNLSIGVFEPKEPELFKAGGRHLFDGVLEVPATSFQSPSFLQRSGSCPWRTLSITGTSKAETESLLWQARRKGGQTVVVLTHPSEFVKRKGFRYENLLIHKINQDRLLSLLDFVKRHDSEFEAVTFGERGHAWFASGTTEAPTVRTRLHHALLRTAQNALVERF